MSLISHLREQANHVKRNATHTTGAPAAGTTLEEEAINWIRYCERQYETLQGEVERQSGVITDLRSTLCRRERDIDELRQALASKA